MKKIFGLMAAAALIVGGSFGFASADPTTPACDDAIDVDCTTVINDEEAHCDLYVNVSDADLFVCEDGLI